MGRAREISKVFSTSTALATDSDLQQQLTRYRFTMSGGETSVSGSDDNGVTLAYTVGTENVFLNGTLLVRGQDYVATNGTSITSLSPALSINDVVEIFSYSAFNVANTYTQSQVDGFLDLKTDVSANGLVHINTTTIGSSVSSVSLPNGTFTSTYDDYKVIIDFSETTAVTSGAFRLRLRVSGVDNATASSYNYTGYTATPSNLSLSNDSSTHWFAGSALDATPDRYSCILELQGVALAKETKMFLTAGSMDGGTRRQVNIGGFHSVQTAFDSLSFRLDSGTVSGGKIRVYGYKN